jgi:hypothetical protein
MSDQLYAPAALPLGEDPLYPLDRRLGGRQSRSGLCGEARNRTPAVQTAVRHYADRAIPVPNGCGTTLPYCNVKYLSGGAEVKREESHSIKISGMRNEIRTCYDEQKSETLLFEPA